MPVTSKISASDYIALFVNRGPQVGHPTDFAISPNGRYIFSSTLTDLVLFDTRIGYPVAFVKTGTTSQLTALEFLNNKKCFIGCHRGHIYVAHIGESVLFSCPSVAISYSFQDVQKPIRALRWEPTEKLLAIGYDDGVSIWKSVSKTWKMVDRFKIPHEGLPGVRTMQFYGQSSRYLFVGGGFGYVTWLGLDRVSYFTHDKQFHRIGRSAISPNGKFLAATTFEGDLYVWALAGAILRPDHSTRKLTSGVEFRAFYSYIPVVITSKGAVAAGTQDGQVELSLTNGTVVGDFYYEHNWAVMGLLAHDNRLYAAYLGPVGALIVVAYTDDQDNYETFKKFYGSKTPRLHPKETFIDINLIPKANVIGAALRSGRSDFGNSSSKPRFNLTTVVVILGICIALWYKLDITLWYKLDISVVWMLGLAWYQKFLNLIARVLGEISLYLSDSGVVDL